MPGDAAPTTGVGLKSLTPKSRRPVEFLGTIVQNPVLLVTTQEHPSARMLRTRLVSPEPADIPPEITELLASGSDPATVLDRLGEMLMAAPSDQLWWAAEHVLNALSVTPEGAHAAGRALDKWLPRLTRRRTPHAR